MIDLFLNVNCCLIFYFNSVKNSQKLLQTSSYFLISTRKRFLTSVCRFKQYDEKDILLGWRFIYRSKEKSTNVLETKKVL